MSTVFVVMKFIIMMPHFDDSYSIEKAIFFDDAYHLFTTEKKENNYFGKQVVFQETGHEGFIYIRKTSLLLKEK